MVELRSQRWLAPQTHAMENTAAQKCRNRLVTHILNFGLKHNDLEAECESVKPKIDRGFEFYFVGICCLNNELKLMININSQGEKNIHKKAVNP